MHSMSRGLGIVLALVLVSVPTMALADIVEWTDSDGVTHYTNLKDEVPSQQAVQVVVDEQIWVPKGPAVTDSNEEPVVLPQPPPPPDRDDEIVRAYIAGVDHGMAYDTAAGGSVSINGPLAITVPQSYAPYAQPGYDWLQPAYIPVASPLVVNSRVGRPRGLVRGIGTNRQFPSPPSISAAGPPPIGAAGRPPVGAAGRPPVGAPGGSVFQVSGSRTFH